MGDYAHVMKLHINRGGLIGGSLIGGLVLSGCASHPADLAAYHFKVPDSIVVQLPQLGARAQISVENSAYGANRSLAVKWSNVPSSAKSLVLLMEDPDTPSGSTFTHWVVTNIPTNLISIESGASGSDLKAKGADEGLNDNGTVGYFGPKPPDPSVHHYHVEIFALDTKLDRAPMAKSDVLKQIEGHVLALGSAIGEFKK